MFKRWQAIGGSLTLASARVGKRTSETARVQASNFVVYTPSLCAEDYHVLNS
jgi:hypothetical protein